MINLFEDGPEPRNPYEAPKAPLIGHEPRSRPRVQPRAVLVDFLGGMLLLCLGFGYLVGMIYGQGEIRTLNQFAVLTVLTIGPMALGLFLLSGVWSTGWLVLQRLRESLRVAQKWDAERTAVLAKGIENREER